MILETNQHDSTLIVTVSGRVCENVAAALPSP